MSLQGVLPNKCLRPIPSSQIKMRAAWVFGQIAAGDSAEQNFSISEDIMDQTERSPVVIVSPVLTSSDTYNADLQYYGYVIDNGEHNGGSLVIIVKNNGSDAVTPPDVAAILM